MVSIHGVKSVIKRNYLSFRRLFKLSIFPNLFEYFLYLIAFGYGFGNMNDSFTVNQYLLFVSTGILISTGMTSATNECLYNSFIQRKVEKTYDAMLMLPIKKLDIVFGQIIWGAVRSLIYGLMFFIVLIIIGIMPISVLGFTIVYLFIAGLIFGSLAMIFSLLATDRNQLVYYNSIFIRTLYLFSGIFFVVDFLPNKLELIIKYNPLYLLVDSYRSLVIDNVFDLRVNLIIGLYLVVLTIIVSITGKKVLNR